MIFKNSSTGTKLGEFGGNKLVLIFSLESKFLVRIDVCTEALSRVIITLSISLFNMLFKIKFIIKINSWNICRSIVLQAICIINCASDHNTDIILHVPRVV